MHASNRLLYAADGMIYHTALAEPAASLGWQVELFERKAVIRQLAELRGLSVQDCDAELQALGKPLGKPWGKTTVRLPRPR